MPLTEKGRKIKAAMTKEYGAKKGERVFYASEKAATIKGVHYGRPKVTRLKQPQRHEQ